MTQCPANTLCVLLFYRVSDEWNEGTPEMNLPFQVLTGNLYPSGRCAGGGEVTPNPVRLGARRSAPTALCLAPGVP
jgi:hypothetical protein